MFRFYSPFWLLLLLPLLGLLLRDLLKRERPAMLFGHVRPLRGMRKSVRQRLLFLLPAFFYLGMVLMILAQARPQSGRGERTIRGEGIAIAFCLDRSGSMRALDFQVGSTIVTRLDAVKKTFRDFVLGDGTRPGRSEDMIALIAFGGYVDTCCPLTLDHETLVAMLDRIQLPEPPPAGRNRPEWHAFFEEEMKTAIGDALAQAVDRLQDSTARSRVIILLSDGEQTTGTLTPEEGAAIAGEFGIKVYTIGIGTTGLVPMEEKLPDGRSLRRMQAVSLDEKTLQRIADTTGGRYFNAREIETLDVIYRSIESLEKTSFEDDIHILYADLFPYFLLPGLLLLALHTVLACTWLRRFP